MNYNPENNQPNQNPHNKEEIQRLIYRHEEVFTQIWCLIHKSSKLTDSPAQLYQYNTEEDHKKVFIRPYLDSQYLTHISVNTTSGINGVGIKSLTIEDYLVDNAKRALTHNDSVHLSEDTDQAWDLDYYDGTFLDLVDSPGEERWLFTGEDQFRMEIPQKYSHNNDPQKRSNKILAFLGLVESESPQFPFELCISQTRIATDLVDTLKQLSEINLVDDVEIPTSD